MKLKRAYSAEPISDETGRRMRMGRNKTRLFGILAACVGALVIPTWIAGIGMGYFKLEDKTITVFPRLMTNDEAIADEKRVDEERAAFREKKAAEEAVQK
ncbi:hypothetical protein [Niveispirillum sp. KHB5.9]|uniref:hypothetical protein n=1 Tax=Niveispirillum sp. KHB5.9 TaxID=3400269 RepID=UPI003A8C373D